jgi:Zn-dependent protease with chaperone function
VYLLSNKDWQILTPVEQVWLIAICALWPVLGDVGYIIVYELSIPRTRNHYEVLDQDLSQRLARLCRQLGCNVMPGVWRVFAGQVYSVRIVCLFRKCRVLVSDRLAKSLDEGQLEVLLAHVAAHVKLHRGAALTQAYKSWASTFLVIAGGAFLLRWLLGSGADIGGQSAVFVVAISAVIAAKLSDGDVRNYLEVRAEMEADSMAAEVVGKERYSAVLSKILHLEQLTGLLPVRLWRLEHGD